MNGVAIHILDHEQGVLGNSSFQFCDGNITSSCFNSWMDRINCQRITVIMNGNRSALAEQEFMHSNREILSSMGPSQSFSKDLFNITRGLEDPSADLDLDRYQGLFGKAKNKLCERFKNGNHISNHISDFHCSCIKVDRFSSRPC